MIATQESLSTREDVRAKLQTILAREEFGERRSWLAERFEKGLDKLGKWLSELFGLADPATSRSVVLATLALAAVTAGILLTWRRYARPAEQSVAVRSTTDGVCNHTAMVQIFFMRHTRCANLCDCVSRCLTTLRR